MYNNELESCKPHLRQLGTSLDLTFLLMRSHYGFHLYTSGVIHRIFLTDFPSTSCMRGIFHLFTLKNQVNFLEQLENYLCCSPLLLSMKYNLVQSLCTFLIGLSHGIVFISKFILHTINGTLMTKNTPKFLIKNPKSLFHC
jgi:hypothetical protein